jgi:hypothetical protein
MPWLGLDMNLGWPPSSVRLEKEVRFPWSGGFHPWPDVVVTTASTLLGIESKRYEPFRDSPTAVFSDAFQRSVWDRMVGYKQVKDELRKDPERFRHLDACQLVKHALGLRTQAKNKRPVLLYLYAEPDRWPDGRPIPLRDIEEHRHEIATFADFVAGDEVAFRAITYRDMLRSWDCSRRIDVRQHVEAVRRRFQP